MTIYLLRKGLSIRSWDSKCQERTDLGRLTEEKDNLKVYSLKETEVKGALGRKNFKKGVVHRTYYNRGQIRTKK